MNIWNPCEEVGGAVIVKWLQRSLMGRFCAERPGKKMACRLWFWHQCKAEQRGRDEGWDAPTHPMTNKQTNKKMVNKVMEFSTTTSTMQELWVIGVGVSVHVISTCVPRTGTHQSWVVWFCFIYYYFYSCLFSVGRYDKLFGKINMLEVLFVLSVAGDLLLLSR